MSTIANRYYNSPWIKDAAENLASALAPPDLDKIAARKKLEWELGRAQEIARVEDETYSNKKGADKFIANVTRLAGDPVKDPMTGEVDWEETNRQATEGLASAFELGGIDYVNPGMKTAGPSAPTFGVAERLADMTAQNRSNQIGQQIQGTLAGIFANNQGQDARQTAGFDYDREKRGEEFERRMQLLVAEQEGDIEAIRARAAAGGGNPLTIAGTVLNDATRLMWQQVENNEATIDKKDFSELVARSAVLISQGRNVPTAVIQTYRDFVNDADSEPEVKSFFGMGGKRKKLHPRFETPLVPKGGIPGITPPPGVTDYGDAVVPRSAPSAGPVAPPAAAPAQDTPPAAALATLEEGIETTFGNNQTWTLRNGVPTRVN